MCGKEIALKKKRQAFSAVCLICAFLTVSVGCSEGGRNYSETEYSKHSTEAQNTDRLVENGSSYEGTEENGVDIAFAPVDGYAADNDELDAARDVLEKRLDLYGIDGYELETDYSLGQIKLRCLTGGSADDFKELSAKLCEKAELTFREGALFDIGVGGEHQLIGNYEELPVVLDGRDVSSAAAFYNPAEKEYSVTLDFNDIGAEKFSEVTERLCETHGIISIYLDDKELCRPLVTAHITDGSAAITGGFTAQSATELADKINIGALPFDMEILY